MKDSDPRPRGLVHVGERLSYEPALLDCEGDPSCGQWVPHVFWRHQALRNKKGSIIHQGGYAIVYKCKLCGKTRRWGIISERARREMLARKGGAPNDQPVDKEVNEEVACSESVTP